MIGSIGSRPNMLKHDDLQTARLAVEGDPAAIAKIRDQILPYCLGVLLSKCHDAPSEEMARDVVADLAADLVFGVERQGSRVPLLTLYQGIGSLRAWCFKVAYSRLKSWWRSPEYRDRVQKVRQGEDGPNIGDTEAPSEEPRDEEALGIFAEALAEALTNLSPRQSVCFRLVYFHGVEQKRLARMFRCDAATVSRDLQQARETIKKRVVFSLRIVDPHLDLRWEDCVGLCERRPGFIGQSL